jgi:50S ribosomal subunit-associated GTPase HflX
MTELKNAVMSKLAEARAELTVLIPLDSGALVSRIYASGQVIDCKYLEEGIMLTAAVTLEDAARLRASAIKIFR